MLQTRWYTVLLFFRNNYTEQEENQIGQLCANITVCENVDWIFCSWRDWRKKLDCRTTPQMINRPGLSLACLHLSLFANQNRK